MIIPKFHDFLNDLAEQSCYSLNKSGVWIPAPHELHDWDCSRIIETLYQPLIYINAENLATDLFDCHQILRRDPKYLEKHGKYPISLDCQIVSLNEIVEDHCKGRIHTEEREFENGLGMNCHNGLWVAEPFIAELGGSNNFRMIGSTLEDFCEFATDHNIDLSKIKLIDHHGKDLCERLKTELNSWAEDHEVAKHVNKDLRYVVSQRKVIYDSNTNIHIDNSFAKPPFDIRVSSIDS